MPLFRPRRRSSSPIRSRSHAFSNSRRAIFCPELSDPATRNGSNGSERLIQRLTHFQNPASTPNTNILGSYEMSCDVMRPLAPPVSASPLIAARGACLPSVSGMAPGLLRLPESKRRPRKPPVLYSHLTTASLMSNSRRGQPGFLTNVTACVASRRSIRKERAEKRSGAYGRGPRRRGRAPGCDPEGGAVEPAGCVNPLARCPASRGAAFLPCRPDSTAQTMTLVRNPGRAQSLERLRAGSSMCASWVRRPPVSSRLPERPPPGAGHRAGNPCLRDSPAMSPLSRTPVLVRYPI